MPRILSLPMRMVTLVTAPKRANCRPGGGPRHYHYTLGKVSRTPPIPTRRKPCAPLRVAPLKGRRGRADYFFSGTRSSLCRWVSDTELKPRGRFRDSARDVGFWHMSIGCGMEFQNCFDRIFSGQFYIVRISSRVLSCVNSRYIKG